jgi:DNA-binding NtrC family response regulator
VQLQALVFTPQVQPGRRSAVCDAFQARQYQIREVRDAPVLLGRVRSRAADVIVLGAGAGCNWTGIDLAREVRLMDRRCPLILLTADSSEEFLIAALRAGVTDVLRQTAAPTEAAACVDRVTALFQPRALPPGASQERGRMVGASPGMCLTREQIHKVSATDSNVLITGETGTGKELVAELIHQSSRRRDRPFVSINCAAIPEGLLESELFGHERGAFTGAHAAREGKLQFAEGGTVFLDEIGDMDLHAQAKILRAIESRRVPRLGGHRDVAIDIRVIAATNQDLENLTAQGRFRKDLYFRLNVARVHLEPLRDRSADIPALIDHLLDEWNGSSERSAIDIDPDLVACLQQYDWPGNIRELRNLVESAFVFCSSRRIVLEDLPPHWREKLRSPLTPVDAERDRVLHALSSAQWNKSEAAKLLHWSRMTLYRKISKHGIQDQNRCNIASAAVTA